MSVGSVGRERGGMVEGKGKGEKGKLRFAVGVGREGGRRRSRLVAVLFLGSKSCRMTKSKIRYPLSEIERTTQNGDGGNKGEARKSNERATRFVLRHVAR